MKYIYTLILLISGLLNAHAADILSENWKETTDGTIPDNWTTWGTDKTPSGIAENLFRTGEGFKVMRLDPTYPTLYAVSYSTSTEGGKVNTGIATPEIEIPKSGAILKFNAANYNPDGNSSNKMTVRVSETGTDIPDFSATLLTKRISGNSSASPETLSVSLAAYAGKKVRIAFINEGSDAGLLGITDIRIADYFASIHNYTPLLFQEGKEIEFDIDLNIQAECKGFKATLTTDDGYSQTLSTNAALDGSDILVKLQFPEHPDIAEESILTYKIEVTPNITGCTSTVVIGSAGCGEGFPAVLVEEEATGEKCGYCPAGAAGLEKFNDEFGDRFVGIGIHCTSSFSTGVMENHDYSDPFLTDPAFVITGLPSAVFNRKRLVNPTEFNLVQKEAENVIGSHSAAQVAIDRVECDFETGDCRVDFTASLALPYVNADISAAAVLIADSLKGYGPKWFQTDYYSGTSEQVFLKDVDDSWWPYMKFYCEYPSKNISPTDMAFNHVGMGIYPDYHGDGCLLPSDWSASQDASASISFTMPMQEEVNEFGVQDIANTSVAVLIFNHSSGEILSAAKVHASDYNRDLSAVRAVRSVESIHITPSKPGHLSVSTPEDGYVDIYASDGHHLFKQELRSGANNISVLSVGMYIVTVHTPSAMVSKKICILK